MKTVTVRIDYDSTTKTYVATLNELPDVYAVSDNRDDVLRRLVGSANEHIQCLRSHNQPLPTTLAVHPELVTVAIDAA